MERCFFFVIVFSPISAISACSSYVDVTKTESTGVEASHELAEKDLNRTNKYTDFIIKVAKSRQKGPVVISSSISRESRAGSPPVLTNGWSLGLKQADEQFHTPEGQWNSEQHNCQGTELLIEFIKKIQNKFPSRSKEQQSKGAVSSDTTDSKITKHTIRWFNLASDRGTGHRERDRSPTTAPAPAVLKNSDIG